MKEGAHLEQGGSLSSRQARHISGAALRIIVTGEFNPLRFDRPPAR
jgi:hypothetical protein